MFPFCFDDASIHQFRLDAELSPSDIVSRFYHWSTNVWESCVLLVLFETLKQVSLSVLYLLCHFKSVVLLGGPSYIDIHLCVVVEANVVIGNRAREDYDEIGIWFVASLSYISDGEKGCCVLKHSWWFGCLIHLGRCSIIKMLHHFYCLLTCEMYWAFRAVAPQFMLLLRVFRKQKCQCS